MIRFKACPRCSGDLSLERDLDGLLWTCLQCGHEIPIVWECPSLVRASAEGRWEGEAPSGGRRALAAA